MYILIAGILASALFGGALAFAQAMESHEEMSHGTSAACAVHCLTAALSDTEPTVVVQSMFVFAVAIAIAVAGWTMSRIVTFTPQPVRVRPRSVGMLTVIKRE